MRFLLLFVLCIAAVSAHQICKPSTAFREGCNYCKCSYDGLTKTCIPVKCHLNIYKDDGSIKPATDIIAPTDTEISTHNSHLDESAHQICRPSTTFREGCNYCRCSVNGLKKKCIPTKCQLNIYKDNGIIKPATDILAPSVIKRSTHNFKL